MNRCLQREMVKNSKLIREKIFLVLTMTMIICLGTLAMAAQKGKEEKIYFECVAINNGDSLWKIAQKYKAEDQKIEHMIYEIMEVNGMRSENIRSGDSIIVPVKKGQY